MKKELKIGIVLLSVFGAISTIAHSFSLVTGGAEPASFRIVEPSYRINYYIPNNDGSEFVLDSYEYVPENRTLSSIPDLPSITNFTFEKWSTNANLSDSFNTGSNITSDLNLYAAYYGYYVKGSDDENYQLTTRYNDASWNVYRLDNTVDYDSESFTYGLLGADVNQGKVANIRLQGNTISSYKRYAGTNTYTLNASKTSYTSDGYYKVCLAPESNKIWFYRTFILELKNCSDNTKAHVWKDGNTSITTSWPGIQMIYLGQTDNNYKRYWAFDVDTSRVDRIIANNNNGGKQTADLTIPSDSLNNAYYCEGYGGDTGWYTFNVETTLYD